MYIPRREVVAGLVFLMSISNLIGGSGTLPQNDLKIIVLRGQDSVNDTKTRAEVPLAVQVQDVNGNPAAGAQVDFGAPTTGPSGTFRRGLNTLTVTANPAGIAEVTTFRPNGSIGSFALTVKASYQGATATEMIAQTNARPPRGSSKKLIGILAGGGAAAAALAALGGDEPLPPPNPPAPTADLTIASAPMAPTFARGGNGSFTLTVTNNGNGATSGTVTVTDTLSTGLTPTAVTSAAGWTCPILGQTVTCTRTDALNPGSSYPAITLPFTVATNATTPLMNTASVSGGGDSNSSNNSSTVSVTLTGPTGPDLTIAKTASAPTFIRGSSGSFTLTITNSGNAATSGTVTVTDTVPTGLTPTAVTNAPGWTCPISGLTVTCTRGDALNATSSYPAIIVPVTVAANAGTPLMNTANVSGGGDTNPSDNSSTVSVNTAAPTDLAITKTASAPTLVRGSTGSFSLTVTNSGGTATTGTVTVTDALPAGLTPTAVTNAPGWTCTITGQTVTCTRSDTLNPGASYTAITVPVTVAANATTPLMNTANVSGGGDTNSSNNSAAVSVNTVSGPDLTIAKTSSAPTFVRGLTGSFTLTITNSGNSATSGAVTVTDTLPPGLTPTPVTNATGWSCSLSGQTVTCTRSNALNAGASYPTITILVNVALTAATTLTNVASVTGGGDANSTNNSASASVNTAGSLMVTKESDHLIVAPGDSVGFRLGIDNPDVPITAATLNDTLPAGIAYKAGTARIYIGGPSGEDAIGETVTPTVNPDGLVFPIGNLPPGSHVAIRYAAVVTSKARPGELQSRVIGVASLLSGERVTSSPVQVRIVVTASAFTLNQVLVGRVFEDSNKNGRFDNGEPGVANVRVMTSGGQAATTDSSGQYNMPSLAGGSIMVAIDPATLPEGLDLPPNETRLGGFGQLLRTPLDGGALLRRNFALIRTSGFPPALESTPSAVADSDEAEHGLAAKLEMIAERTVMSAGASDKQLIRIRAFDDSNQDAAATPVVVTTLAGTIMVASKVSDRLACESVLSLEQRRDQSRQIVVETHRGEAVICLISDVVPGTTHLTAIGSRDPQLSAAADVRFEAAQRPPLLVGIGELGIGLSGPGIEATENARRVDGQVSIFYQDSLVANDLLTVAVRSKQGLNSATGNAGLFESDPTQLLYPVMGDGSTRQELAQSTSRVYARYDRGRSYVMYGDLRGDAAVTGRSSLLEYNRNVTGLRFQLEGQSGTNWLQGQMARPRSAYIREISTALSGSTLRLSRSQIIQGSETISLEVRDRRNPERIVSRETLIRNVDYTLDPLSGVLFMMRPIGLFDSSLNLVQVVSSYEYQTTGVDSAVYRGRGSYSLDKLGLRFGLSALTQSEGGLNFTLGGLELEQRLPNGGRFKAEMPLSNGRLSAVQDGSSPRRSGACCEIGDARNGKAIRAEFEQPLGARNTMLRGRLARTDEGFLNPYGSVTVPGQESREISLETRSLESGRVRLSIGKEVNRNSAVDNERKTISAKLSQTLRENLSAEAGVDRREFKDHHSGQEIDSHLVSAGLQWKPFSRIETSVLREQNLTEADPTYPNQTVLGAQFRMTSFSRLFATKRFSSAAIVPIAGAETTGMLSPQSTGETAIGVESRLSQNTSITSRYRVDSGAAGADSFAVIGVLTRVPVRPGLSIDWTLDNAVHLTGKGRGYIGGSVGLSQSKEDKLQLSARYELRRREISENIFMAAVAGRLTESMSALARYRISSLGIAARNRISGSQLALSVRPRQSDRIALLFSYDSNVTPLIQTVSAANSARTDRLSVDGLLQVRPGLESYSRVAAFRVPGIYTGSRLATYLQTRLQQSLSHRFDIAVEMRWIREARNISGTLVTGVEGGTWLTRDLRVGLGYSPKGFANPGALLNSTAARGGAYVVISSRLSGIFDLVEGSKKYKQSETRKAEPQS